MTSTFKLVDIWLGRFDSNATAEEYFHEQYDDDEPVSAFARDQGENFIDHDFVERSSHERRQDELGPALVPHSFSASYLSAATRAFARERFSFDALVLVWGPEVAAPRSVSQDGVDLHYLGRFACDPDQREA